NKRLSTANSLGHARQQPGLSEGDGRANAASQHMLTAYSGQAADIEEPSEEELQAQHDQLVEHQSQAGGESSEVPPFEDVQDQLAQQTVAQQQNEAATTLAGELRESGDVTINL